VQAQTKHPVIPDSSVNPFEHIPWYGLLGGDTSVCVNMLMRYLQHPSSTWTLHLHATMAIKNLDRHTGKDADLLTFRRNANLRQWPRSPYCLPPLHVCYPLRICLKVWASMHLYGNERTPGRYICSMWKSKSSFGLGGLKLHCVGWQYKVPTQL